MMYWSGQNEFLSSQWLLWKSRDSIIRIIQTHVSKFHCQRALFSVGKKNIEIIAEICEHRGSIGVSD